MAKNFGGRWEHVKDLSEGGQAWTYLVKRVPSGPDSTLHVLKRLKNPKRLGRFSNEIEAIKKLSHPAVIKMIDYDLDCETPYLVTEYCEGGPLSKATAFWRATPSDALLLFEQILEGMKHIHENEVIHRDIKPENVFLRTASGPPVMGDFGLSFMLDDDERHTMTNEAVGSRHYMAPELEDGRVEAVNSSSDVYSLGKLLYWLFTGRVFSREEHRDERNDVKRFFKDPFTGQGSPELEHVNELLDFMITKNPHDRRDVENLLALTRQARRLVSERFHALTLKIRHPCSFCGRGTYALKVDGDVTATRNFGMNPMGADRKRVLVCDRCRHVQIFDFGPEGEWR